MYCGNTGFEFPEISAEFHQGVITKPPQRNNPVHFSAGKIWAGVSVLVGLSKGLRNSCCWKVSAGIRVAHSGTLKHKERSPQLIFFCVTDLN